eukprot:gb/GFBE01028258.1/.p1 GENE.gb/GFBE01028258.1/~~gb/GFBE01028258.1/.p1  ORF type:complete len:189 (+),score=43.97 gb/GFBE01028258.1/:1-567(+)
MGPAAAMASSAPGTAGGGAEEPVGAPMNEGRAEAVSRIDGPVTVRTCHADGASTSQVTWQIANPAGKFKAGCGCALVSPSFSAGGLNDLRLLFAPGRRWTAEQARKQKKETKDKKDVPLNGSLQLKLGGETSNAGAVQLYFTVGSIRMGPFDVSSKQCTSEMCEIPSDWRKAASRSGNLLCVGVEIVQ